MCYSAEAWTLYDNYVKEFGADIDIREFWEVYLKRDEAWTSPGAVGIPGL